MEAIDFRSIHMLIHCCFHLRFKTSTTVPRFLPLSASSIEFVQALGTNLRLSLCLSVYFNTSERLGFIYCRIRMRDGCSEVEVAELTAGQAVHLIELVSSFQDYGKKLSTISFKTFVRCLVQDGPIQVEGRSSNGTPKTSRMNATRPAQRAFVRRQRAQHLLATRQDPVAKAICRAGKS